MPYSVGSIEATLRADFDDADFRRFDRALDKATSGVRELTREQAQQGTAMRKAGTSIKGAERSVESYDRAMDSARRSADQLNRANVSGTRATDRFGGAMGTLGTAAKYAAIGVGALAVLEIPRLINAYRESYKVARQTNAVLESTGGVANVTAKGVENLANSLSRKTGIDDEQIAAMQNMLLTFTQIRNEAGENNKVFDETTRVTLDLARATGVDLNGAAKQVGKALNDPATGLTALRRSGASFNETQTETIKSLFESGKRLEAQKLILRELDREFKGSAIAQGDPFDKLKVSVENVEEAMGKALFPVFSEVANEAERQFGRIEKIISNPNLTGEQKFERVLTIIERVIDRGIDRLNKHLPQIAEVGGKIGLRLAGSLVKAFINAPIIGKLAVGFWVIKAFGGWGALAGLGGRAGGRMAKSMGTRFLAVIGPYLGVSAGAESLGGVLAAKMGALRGAFGRAGTTLGKTMAGRIVMALSLPGLILGLVMMIPKNTRQAALDAGYSIGDSIKEGIKRSLSKAADELSLGSGGLGGDFLREKLGDIFGGLLDVRPTGGKTGGLVTGDGILGMKRGGSVPGLHPDDTVPAMLEPGEFVMRKAAVDKLGVPFLRTLNDKGKVAKEAAKGKEEIGDTFDDLGKETKRKTEKTEKQVVETWKSMRKKTVDSQRLLGRSVKDSWRDIDQEHGKRTRDMDQATGRRFRSMLGTVRTRGAAMESSMSDTMGSLQSAVIGGMGKIASQTNAALKAFGVKPVSFGVKEGESDNFAGGGFIAGQGKQDTVPLVLGMAAPGEAILSGPQQAEVEQSLAMTRALGLGNYGSLDSLFANVTTPHYAHARGGRIPKFARGGSIGVDGARPGFVPFMNFLNSMFGPIYTMSGLRPGSITTSGSLSNHATGNAVDISTHQNGLNFADSAATLNATGAAATRMDALHAYMAKYIGLPGDFLWRTDTGGNHWNHIHRGITSAHADSPELMMQYLSALPGSGFGQVNRQILTGPNGALKSLGQAGLDKVRKAAQKYLQKKSSTRMFGLGAAVDPHAYPGNQQLGRAMMQSVFPVSEWPALQELWMRESGWDETARNPTSGAYGIPQALPPSKMGPVAQGSGPEAAKAQIGWGLGYIKERYGSPSAALSFHDANNWYARGGRIPKFNKGGFVGNINRRYPEHNSANGDWGGTRLPKFVIAALAQAAGMPGRTMEQVTRGESGGRPGATGVDPGGTKGYGLWMITTSFNDQLVKKYGGYKEMLNPVKNAAAASEIYKSQGLGAWYGDDFVTGDGIPYTGKYNIQNALGGLGFQAALRGKGKGGGKGEGKPEVIRRPTGGALPGGGGGSYTVTKQQLADDEKRAATKRKIRAARRARFERFLKSQQSGLKSGRREFKAPNFMKPFRPRIGPGAQSSVLAAHSPIASDLGAYGSLFDQLAAVNPRLEAIRDSYLGTFDMETSKSVFKRQEDLRRRQQKAIEEMRENMNQRMKATLAGRRGGGVTPDGKQPGGKKPGKREAAMIRRQFRKAIREQTRKIRKTYDPSSAMKPVLKRRKNLENRFESLSARGSAVSDLLTEARTNVRRTARVSSAGSRALSGFASGGYVGAPVSMGGQPVVHVTIADPTLSALDPHIEVRVNEKIAQVGQVTKQRQRAAGSTGRRARV